MKKLLSTEDFIDYLNQLRDSQQLRTQFKSRYLAYGIKDITLIPVSADFHVMWKIVLEYKKFLQTPLTFSMFDKDSGLFVGLIDVDISIPKVYSLSGKPLFVNESEIAPIGYKISEITSLNPVFLTPLYSQEGIMVDATQYL